jgi:hypothetical protein
VVVGRNRREAALPRGVDRPTQPLERKALLSELYERQMDAEVHAAMLSTYGPGVRELLVEVPSPVVRLS